MTSATKNEPRILPLRRFKPTLSLALLIQLALGGVFLIAAFAKALDSDDVRRAVEATIDIPISSAWLVGALIAFEAGLGASLISMRRSIIPPILAALTIMTFSVWLMWADRALPSLSCGCFGGTGVFGRELTLGESLIRNGLLLFACAALIVQRLVLNHPSISQTEPEP